MYAYLQRADIYHRLQPIVIKMIAKVIYGQPLVLMPTCYVT